MQLCHRVLSLIYVINVTMVGHEPSFSSIQIHGCIDFTTHQMQLGMTANNTHNTPGIIDEI